MMFATKALKWHRMSFRVSESFSFSASRSCRVKSTYSNNVLLRKCVSLSRPPLALKIPKRRRHREKVTLSIPTEVRTPLPPSEEHPENLVWLGQNDTLRHKNEINMILASLNIKKQLVVPRRGTAIVIYTTRSHTQVEKKKKTLNITGSPFTDIVVGSWQACGGRYGGDELLSKGRPVPGSGLSLLVFIPNL